MNEETEVRKGSWLRRNPPHQGESICEGCIEERIGAHPRALAGRVRIGDLDRVVGIQRANLDALVLKRM